MKTRKSSLIFALWLTGSTVFAAPQLERNPVANPAEKTGRNVAVSVAPSGVDWQSFHKQRAALYKGFDGGKDAARKSYEKLVPLVETTYAQEPMQLSSELNTIAVRCMVTGLFPEAESLLTRAGEILHDHHGQDTRSYGRVLSNLGRLYETTGKYDQAGALLQNAMELRAGDCRGYANSKGWLGRVYLHEQNYQQAHKTLDEVVAYRVECGSIGPDYIEATDNLIDLAEASLALDKPSDALGQAQRALGLRKGANQTNLTPRLYSIAKPLSVQALAEAKLGDVAAGQKNMTEAIAVADKLPQPDCEVADVFENAAALDLIASNKTAAAKNLKRALEMRTELFGKDNVIVERTQKKLAAM